MARPHRLSLVLWLVLALGLAVSPAAAGRIEFVVAQGPDGFYAGIDCVADGVIDDAQMQKQGSSDWIPFDIFEDGFDVESGSFASLALMVADIAGDYVFEIQHAGGVSQYTFTIAPAQADWFPALPVLAAVDAQIPQQYLFTWAWEGSADARAIEYEGYSGSGLDVGMMYPFGSAGFADLSYYVDFGGYTGWGEFEIIYGNYVNALVTNWSLRPGDVDLFDEMTSVALSFDAADFQVVPEPATMFLTALGGLALLRRRRLA